MFNYGSALREKKWPEGNINTEIGVEKSEGHIGKLKKN